MPSSWDPWTGSEVVLDESSTEIQLVFNAFDNILWFKLILADMCILQLSTEDCAKSVLFGNTRYPKYPMILKKNRVWIGYCQKLSGRVGYRVPVSHWSQPIISWKQDFFVGIIVRQPYLHGSDNDLIICLRVLGVSHHPFGGVNSQILNLCTETSFETII